jgi:hypothetical protein
LARLDKAGNGKRRTARSERRAALKVSSPLDPKRVALLDSPLGESRVVTKLWHRFLLLRFIGLQFPLDSFGIVRHELVDGRVTYQKVSGAVVERVEIQMVNMNL